MRKRYSISILLWEVAAAVLGWASYNFLHVGIIEVISAVTAATAAPLVGLVFFDFKAFSRSAAEVSNMILGRLGHRSFGTGSLCRPHGL